MWTMTGEHLRWLAEIAACPECRAPLETAGETLVCSGCGTVYAPTAGYINLMPTDGSPILQGEASYHSEVAAHWAELVGLDSAKTRMLHDDFLADLRSLVPPGSLILELGCGGGQDAACLIEQGYRYVGLDVAPGMLDASAREFKDPGAYNRILLCLADGEQLPFQPSTFDAVLIVSALHHMSRPDRCLAQIAGCLKPGGIVVAGSEPNSWPYTLRRLRRSPLGRRLGLHREAYRPHRDGSPADFDMVGFSRAELLGLFHNQGFDVLSAKSFWHLSSIACFFPYLPGFVEERLWAPIDRRLARLPACRSWGMHWNVIARLPGAAPRP